MRYLRLTLALIILAAVAGSAPTWAATGVPASESGRPAAAGAQAFGAALDIGYAYDYLSPYGTWLTLDSYGYVWCPRHMGYGWRPYTEGHWLWSDDGWFWDADEDWGWMPFHYGRWGWDNDCGWFWVPGADWGPAWVFWRFGDPYCGWAPIPPGIAFGADVDFDALALGIPFNFWVFVDGRHFLDNDLRRYALPYERNATIVGMTQFRNRYEFRGGRMIDEGIDVDSIRRVTGRPVTRYALADADRPGPARISGNEARVYRPAFQENREARPKQAMGREEARREMGTAKVYEAPRQRQGRATPPETAVRKRQAEERAMLQKSQAEERRNIQRRQTEELRKAPSPSDRDQLQQQHQAQMAEQQKKHQAETQQMNERHRTETEQMRQSPPPKTSSPRRK